MTKLSPAQQRVLTAAAKQPKIDVREHTKDIKVPAARDKVVESMLKRGLIMEDPDADGVVYIISAEGFAAVGKKAPKASVAAEPEQAEVPAAEKKPAKKKVEGEKPPRDTKGGMILTMLRKGATVEKLMEATGWQSHSVRGFISNLRRKQQIDVHVAANASGERVYKIA